MAKRNHAADAKFFAIKQTFLDHQLLQRLAIETFNRAGVDTELGESLEPVIHMLMDWGDSYEKADSIKAECE